MCDCKGHFPNQVLHMGLISGIVVFVLNGKRTAWVDNGCRIIDPLTSCGPNCLLWGMLLQELLDPAPVEYSYLYWMRWSSLHVQQHAVSIIFSIPCRIKEITGRDRVYLNCDEESVHRLLWNYLRIEKLYTSNVEESMKQRLCIAILLNLLIQRLSS